MAKQPSFQFYPGDWLKDPALRRCSPTARGAFMDLLCYAFECEPRGYLITNGTPWTERICAKVASVRVVFVRELVTQGVLRRDEETGAFYNKRMVEDERLRRLRADSGSLGGQQTAKQKSSKRAANRVANRVAKSGSSSSSSSSTSVGAPKGASSGTAPRARERDPIFDTIQELWFPSLKKIPAEVGKRIGKVKRQLVAHTDCTPDEIRARRKRMVSEFGTKGDTPESMAKHWGKFAGGGDSDWFDELARGAQ